MARWIGLVECANRIPLLLLNMTASCPYMKPRSTHPNSRTCLHTETQTCVHTHTRIGVATGSVFCGIVGSDARKAFDILGEPVNLACRLMSLCSRIQHSFLCDEATSWDCQGRFLFQRLRKRYALKGQSSHRLVFTLEEDQHGGAGLGLDILRRRLEVHGLTSCGRHQEKVSVLLCSLDVGSR